MVQLLLLEKNNCKGVSHIEQALLQSVHWRDWCGGWSSSTLATWCEEPSHWEKPWSWEGLKAGGEGDDGGPNGWMASWTQGTWVSANSGRWWRTGDLGVLQSTGSPRVRHDWATEQHSCSHEISMGPSPWPHGVPRHEYVTVAVTVKRGKPPLLPK